MGAMNAGSAPRNLRSKEGVGGAVCGVGGAGVGYGVARGSKCSSGSRLCSSGRLGCSAPVAALLAASGIDNVLPLPPPWPPPSPAAAALSRIASANAAAVLEVKAASFPCSHYVNARRGSRKGKGGVRSGTMREKSDGSTQAMHTHTHTSAHAHTPEA